jgi:glycosyltransferase involved in cell wall biosynthesis
VQISQFSGNVLHVTETLSGGGAEELVRSLTPCLSARGFRVGIVTVSTANIGAAELNQLPATVYEIRKRHRADLPAFPRLVRSIKTFKPDIIHAHTYAGKYWGRGAAALARAPVILTEHGAAYGERPLERLVSRFLNRHTAAIVTFSERTAQAIASTTNHTPVRVIPNGVVVDLPYDRGKAREALGCRNRELAIVTVGRLWVEKAPEVAMRAVARLPGDLLSKTRFHWIGDGPLIDKVRAESSMLGIEDRVIFHGYRADARLIIAGADVALSSSAIEAAPVWLLEAMAAGIPIVGTPTMGVHDLVVHGETGLIATTHDASAVSQMLEKALSDDEWRQAAGAAARKRARQYDIEHVADLYAQLYREVITHGRAAQ